MKSPTNLNGNNLTTWLQSARSMFMPELFTITLRDGTVLRYNTLDIPITLSGFKFLSGPPNFKRGAIEEAVKLKVASMDFTVDASLSDQLNGTPILASIAQGKWDSATIEVKRLFLSTTLEQIGYFIRFLGQLGPVEELTRTHAKFSAKSMLELLNQKMPLKVIQPTCVHTLFDAGCGLAREDFSTTGDVHIGTTVNTLYCGLADTTGVYDQGRLDFTSGELDGLSVSVASYTAGTPAKITLNRPLPLVPSVGSTFTISKGCDKTQLTCQNTFSNLANFLGFPFSPNPEVAI